MITIEPRARDFQVWFTTKNYSMPLVTGRKQEDVLIDAEKLLRDDLSTLQALLHAHRETVKGVGA